MKDASVSRAIKNLMCDTEELPQSLQLLDHLSTSGTKLRRQLCVAVATIARQIAAEQQRALAQV